MISHFRTSCFCPLVLSYLPFSFLLLFTPDKEYKNFTAPVKVISLLCGLSGLSSTIIMLTRNFLFVQKHVDTLVEIKLEKHKNLWEESRFYWGEIEDGTLTFDRPQVEVFVYLNLCKSFL